MMRKNLDYGLLHAMTAFIRVVDAGSFTAAALQMALTTAQVSRLVSDLESRLQTQLLQRTTRRLALTGVGERYANECRSILELVAEAESNAAGAAVQPSGRLRVMCMASFGSRYVVPLVSQYCARYPQVQVEYSTSQYVPDLLAEGTDVSVYLAQQLRDSGLVAHRLGSTFAVLCAAPDYLARCGTPKHPRELVNHACLRLVNPSITPHWELTDGKHVHALDPSGPVVGNNPEVVVHGVLSALGIAMLPCYTVVDALRKGALVQVLPRWRSPEIGVFALIPSRRFIDAKTRAWLELLKAETPAALERDVRFFEPGQMAR
ncbi:LysR family transcriptional regulator, partial [Burkholderia sp. 3C]